MLNNLLKVSQELAAQGYPKDDVPIGEVALYAVLGFFIIFVGISFLIFVVWLVGRIMNGQAAPSAKKVGELPKQSKPEPIIAAPAALSEGSDEIDEETLAVITAAIMAYYQQQKNKCEFTLKRIKRI